MAWDAGLPHKTLLQPPNAGTAEPFRVSPPEAVAYPLELSLFRFMCYAVPPRIGGPHYGRFTVCRCTVSPDGVSGFHQPDARGVSDLDLPLRGRVPGAYGGVALRWDTPDGLPIYRLQELPVADAGRSALLSAHVPED